jgi:hypothetical protein
MHSKAWRLRPQTGPMSGGGALHGNEALLDGEREDGREHIAAIRRGIHEWLVEAHLREQEFEIDARPRGALDDADLAGQGIRAAQPIDLAGIGRAHGGQQDAVAQRRVPRQVLRQKEGALRGAATHQGAGNGGPRARTHEASRIGSRPGFRPATRMLYSQSYGRRNARSS